MPTGQNYSSVAVLAALTAGISNAATTCTVNTTSGFPATPFTIVLDPSQANQEICDVTNVTGLTLTITRAVDGSSAQSHSNNAQVMHAGIGRDFREARAHIDASTSNDSQGHSVHGLQNGSSVVGTTDPQTLTNKTLTSPVLNKITVGNTATGDVPLTVNTVAAQTGDLLDLNVNGVNKVAIAADGSITTTGSGTFNGASGLSVTGASGLAVTQAGTFGQGVGALDFIATGLTGANNQSRWVGCTTGGPPSSGTFSVGDYVVDRQWGIMWICTSGGSPGTWNPSGQALLQKVTLGSAGSITLNAGSSIPSYFSNLKVVLWGTSTDTGGVGFADLRVQFNGDSAADYSWHYMYTQNGGTVSSADGTAVSSASVGGVANGNISPGSGGANGQSVLEIGGYSLSGSKVVTFKAGAASGVGVPNNYHTWEGFGYWGNNKPAITSILLFPSISPNTFTSGTTAWLYAY